MNTDKNRELLWRTVPFVMAMLLLALTGIPASAIFGREKGRRLRRTRRAHAPEHRRACLPRHPLHRARSAAIDREGGEVSFAIAEQPSKGTVTLDGETFVYTSVKNKTGRGPFHLHRDRRRGQHLGPRGGAHHHRARQMRRDL